jgi:hypothetical protein
MHQYLVYSWQRRADTHAWTKVGATSPKATFC